MDVSIIGTLVNAKGLEARPFDMSFTISGGGPGTVPNCGWQLINANVSNFSAEILGAPVADPSSFQANIVDQPHFTCASTQLWGELVSDHMYLFSEGALFSPGSRLTGGELNGWQIEQAFEKVTNTVSTPEPGILLLFALGLAFLGRFRKRAAR